MRRLLPLLFAVFTLTAAHRVPEETLGNNLLTEKGLLDAEQASAGEIESPLKISSSGSGISHPSAPITILREEVDERVPKAQEPIILPPISSKQGAELAVLMVPGAYINAAAYQPLGEALQVTSSLRMWVGLVRPFALDLPNPAQCNDNIELTLQMMIDQGMNASTRVLLAGHSLGGVVMQEWMLSNLPRVTGMILMASEYNGDFTSAPLPVLQLSGDIDGLVRVAEVEPFFRELEEAVQTDPESVITKPVVILTDLNHMQFASGEPSTAVEDNDILSPLTEEEGHTMYAMHMSAFITTAFGEPLDQVDEARAILETDFIDTKEILRPMIEMRELTAGETYSPWASTAQLIISNVDPSFSDSVVVNDTMFSEVEVFETFQPVIEASGETAVVNTYSMVSFIVLGLDHLESAQELAIKLKRQEAVAEILGPFGVPFMNASVSCRDVNEAAIAAAMASASDHVTERYYSRARPFVLLEDDLQLSGPQWLASEILYNDTEDSVVVQSTSLETGLGVPLGFDGMYYCKLLPPSRALEYIMLESLRGTEPASLKKEVHASSQQFTELELTSARKKLNVVDNIGKDLKEKSVDRLNSIEDNVPLVHHKLVEAFKGLQSIIDQGMKLEVFEALVKGDQVMEDDENSNDLLH